MRKISVATVIVFLPTLHACSAEEGENQESLSVEDVGEGEGGEGGESSTEESEGDTNSEGGDASMGGEDESSTGGEDESSTGGEPEGCEGYPDPGIENAVSGMPVNHLEGLDGYGEPIAFCDYVGKPTIIDFSFWGCSPCEFLASWLAGMEPESEDEYVAFYLDETKKLELIKEKLDSGELKWITIITGDPAPGYGPPTPEGVKLWHETWPTEKAQVMLPQIDGVDNPETFFDANWKVVAGPTIGAFYEDFTWAAIDFEGHESSPGDTMDGFLSKSFE